MAKIVIALGGNAILRPGQKGTFDEQMANVRLTAEKIVQLVRAGDQVIVTHGNGPQVGNLLIQHEAGRNQVPALPLDVCGAQTQGQIGYMIQHALTEELNKLSIDKPVAAIITRVRVDENDPAFANPTKPVGPFFSVEHAKQRREAGEHWVEDSGRGWRRVVPSPRPVEIMELTTIEALAAQEGIVIAAGGGGIPVVQRDGGLVGAEAVIDKDLAGCRLAMDVQADMLMILTDVEKVAIDFGKPSQVDLAQIDLSEAQTYLDQGQFGAGSMGPKVQAAMEFVKTTGGRAIITSLVKAVEAVEGTAGTSIVK
ncbi:MAG: carbamate kinase [Firmicutes bacterium]|nr:carbamate kinase [Bacillota bacterium]